MDDSKAAIAVIGAGTMGRQLSIYLAAHGHEVVMWNQVARPAIQGELRKIASIELRRKALPDGLDRDVLLGRIRLVADLSQIKACSVAIEAVAEDYAVKREILGAASRLIDDKSVLATNTSSLDLEVLSGSVADKERFIGLHFFNPVASIPLVEVGKTRATSDRTIALIGQFLDGINKKSLVVSTRPGYIVNRVLFAMINEAIIAADSQVADASEIDSAIRLSSGHPMGPLQLADFIGLDICLAILANLHRETGDNKYAPPNMLKAYVAAGHMGRKTKKGFYDY
jgi:3-hydroxybutyryl-CoA dehydrogenase